MRIKSLELKAFKRFHYLRIQDIPNTVRLVVLAGPHGCGKSSLFDACAIWHRLNGFGNWNGDATYYQKTSEADTFWPDKHRESIKIEFHEPLPAERSLVMRKSFYFRSAYRNDADFRVGSLSILAIARPSR